MNRASVIAVWLAAAAAAAATAACSGKSPSGPSESTALAVSAVLPMNASAFMNEQIVIDGVGFRPGMAVHFGTARATVTDVQPQRMLVTSPAIPAGMVDLVVTRPGGEEVRVAGFEFLDLQVSGPLPDAGLPPAWMVLHGAGFRAGARVLFGGVPATIHRRESRAIELTAPFMSPGKYDIEVVNSDGRAAGKAAAFEYLPVALALTQSTLPPGGVTRVSWQTPFECGDFGGGHVLVLSRVSEPNIWQWDVEICSPTGSVNMPVPTVPGDYELRYLIDRQLYVSQPFSVTGGDR